MQIFIHHLTWRATRFCWKYVCSFSNSRGGRLIRGEWIWENLLNSGKRSKQSCVVFMGLAVLKLDCDLLRMVVEVDTLFHNADVAATSSGFWYVAESAVSTVVFPDGVGSCMETPVFIVCLWIRLVLTDKSHVIICISGVVGCETSWHQKPHTQACWVPTDVIFHSLYYWVIFWHYKEEHSRP